MKKYILFAAAFLGMAANMNAQNAYNMKIAKANGTVITIPVDSVTSVSYEKPAADVPAEQTDYYKAFAGKWMMTFMDQNDMQVKDITISLPEESSEDYGKILYAHAPAFLSGKKSYDFDFKMSYAYDETAQTGTVAIIVDDAKIGKFNDDMNLFWRLDNLPTSDAFISGEYKFNFKASDIDNGKSFKCANRSQTLYIVAAKGETYNEANLAGTLNIVGSARLKKAAE